MRTQEPIPTSRIAQLINGEAEAHYMAAHAAFWAECHSYRRPGIEAPPAPSGTLDDSVVRTRGASAEAARAADLDATRQTRAPLQISLIKGLGASKVRALQREGIVTVEALATTSFNADRALRLTGRAITSYSSKPEAIRTVQGWQEKAIALLKSKNVAIVAISGRARRLCV